MEAIFKFFGEWAKKFFFVATALSVAALNLLMLMDVFVGNILFVILGMVFFSVATWVYLATAFSASDDSKRSGTQVGIAWTGLALSLVGELCMAGFEILRMQNFIASPPWIDMVTIIVIEAAIVIHLLLGIAYFAASSEYNQRLHRLFEQSKRQDAEEKLRKARADSEIEIQEEATDRGIELTRSMLQAALPVVAERKARLMAGEIARTFGLDADLELNHAFEQAITEYRQGYNTRAMAYNTVIDGQSRPAPSTGSGQSHNGSDGSVQVKPADIGSQSADPTSRRKPEKNG